MEEEDLPKKQLKFVMLEYDRSRKRFMTSFTVFSLKDFDIKQVKKTWQNLKPSLTVKSSLVHAIVTIFHSFSLSSDGQVRRRPATVNLSREELQQAQRHHFGHSQRLSAQPAPRVLLRR